MVFVFFMYKQNFTRSSSPQRGGRGGYSGGSARFGSRGGSRGGGLSRHGGGRRFGGERIDPSKFIKKAVVTTEETPVFIPEHNFSDFEIETKLKENILALGYKTPTPIQDKAIPHILRGEDVVGIANTGTGKTAAFLIPLIHKVLTNAKENVIIMAPTRELALQIDEELKKFTRQMKIFSAACVGGASIGKQISDLRYRNEFVIGTPGRLQDLIERKCLDMSKFNTVVLDEADRMLDMGFVNDMKYIIGLMPKEKHTLFFSATISREIEGLISQFLRNPVRISVKTGDTAENVDQDVVRVGRGKVKVDVLHDILNQTEFNKVLIFGMTKHGVEKLTETLIERGFKAESIHGNKNQAGRQRALKMFKDNKVQILVATDVAARGLDISDVSHVINYELPTSYKDYVHRIGRTGRGGKKGKALTFIE